MRIKRVNIREQCLPRIKCYTNVPLESQLLGCHKSQTPTQSSIPSTGHPCSHRKLFTLLCSYISPLPELTGFPSRSVEYQDAAGPAQPFPHL